jgi:CheY-like chemotaxis protein
MKESGNPAKVLLVDNDADIADVVVAILSDEGYAVATLLQADHHAIASAVGMQEPDCVLLDGTPGQATYGGSWAEAAYLAARDRAIPTIMFTAHARDVEEARTGESDRALAAYFAAIVPKPFDLDELLDAVATACAASVRFDATPAGDRTRTRELARRLKAAGATDVRTSERREWATFRDGTGDELYQLYWWQRLGVYIVGRYDADAHLQPVGQFFELAAAIDAALRAKALAT